MSRYSDYGVVGRSMELWRTRYLCWSKPGQLIVCWPDCITMLVVRVSTLLIIGILCAQTQCEINPTRGNPFHYELANTNPLHVRKFRERWKLLHLSSNRVNSVGNQKTLIHTARITTFDVKKKTIILSQFRPQ